jgi:hypothetical protein
MRDVPDTGLPWTGVCTGGGWCRARKSNSERRPMCCVKSCTRSRARPRLLSQNSTFSRSPGQVRFSALAPAALVLRNALLLRWSVPGRAIALKAADDDVGSPHHDTVAPSIGRQLEGPGHGCDDLESAATEADKHAEEDGGGHLQSEAEQDQGVAWAQVLEAGGALDIVEYLEALMDLELVPQAVSVDAAVQAFEDLQSDIGASGKVHFEQFKQLFLILSSGPYDNEAAAKLLQAERDREQEQERADGAAASALLLDDGMAQDEEKLQQRQAAAADACFARSMADEELRHCKTQGLPRCETQGPPRGGGLAEIDVQEDWNFGHHVSDKHLTDGHSPPPVKTRALEALLGHGCCHMRYTHLFAISDTHGMHAARGDTETPERNEGGNAEKPALIFLRISRNSAMEAMGVGKDADAEHAHAFGRARGQGDAHVGARDGAAREKSDVADAGESKRGVGRGVGVPGRISSSARVRAYSSCGSANMPDAGGGPTQTSLAVLEQYTVQDVEGLVAQATHPLPASLRKVRLLPSLTPCRFLRGLGREGCRSSDSWRLRLSGG